MTSCAVCGFEYVLSDAEQTPDTIVAAARELSEVVLAPSDGCRTRPDEATWSPLEYMCHVRDVLLTQRERVLLARRTEEPETTPMGRDERVVHDGYIHQRPEDVARQLNDAALMLAGCLRSLDAVDWERTLLYNYPQASVRTLRWLAIHSLHEIKHHTHDIVGAT